MVSKIQIKFVKSLSLLKFRQKYDKFTAEGEKTVVEFLKNGIFPVEKVFITSDQTRQNLKPFLSQNILEEVSSHEMAQMSMFKTPSPVLAIFTRKENKCDPSKLSGEKTIFLDDIQDPGNMGTIIRIADWFGIRHIVRSKGSADFFHPKVIQSTMGSLCNMKTCTGPLKSLVELNPGIPVIGALLDGTEVSNKTNLPNQGILVIGNEGHGIQFENQNYITEKIFIPGHKDRVAESLNAAIACGIICHRWFTFG